MNLFKYKDYYGDAHCDTREQILHGKIQFINDLITYEAETLEGLEAEFRAAVDDYLETCKALNKEPAKPFKGSFNIRISPELHRKAAVRALMASVSLNEWVSDAIQTRLEQAAARQTPAEYATFSWDVAFQGKLNQYVASTPSLGTDTHANEAGKTAVNERYADAA